MSAQRIPRLARVLVEEASRIPLVRRALQARYARNFNATSGQVRLFHGVYRDFDAARRDIPAGRLQGYDNAPSARLHLGDRQHIYPFDYPVLFWLQKLLPQSQLLLDWGGNVGTLFFAYRRYLSYPAGLTWMVSDVPAVGEMGAALAARESVSGLRFTSSLEDLPRADLLLASGSLHFMEEPFAPLRAAAKLPPHVLLNKVPAYDLPGAVTLHNMGSAFCPYHLFNETAFVTSFESLGYRLIDRWSLPSLSCYIPYFPQHSIPEYAGYYFSSV